MQAAREAALLQALTSQDAAIPSAFLEALGPTQWTVTFQWLLDSVLSLFSSVSRVDYTGKPELIVLSEGENMRNAITRRILKAFAGLKLLFKRVSPDKRTNLDLETLQTWLSSLTSLTSQSILDIEEWNSLKTLIFSEFSKLLKRLVKEIGDLLHNPVFFRLIKSLSEAVSQENEDLCDLLALCLYRIGPLFMDLVENYIKKTQLKEKIIDNFRKIGENDVILGTAKNLHTRKIGNSHQKRSKKNTNRRKIQSLEQEVSCGPAKSAVSEGILSYCGVVLAYLESGGRLELEGWVQVDWGRLSERVQSMWLDIALASSLGSGQWRPLERALEHTVRQPHLAVQSRKAMFVLRQVRDR